MHEKPANIVRKRLIEAGYEEADGLHCIGMEDIQYLMKFVYKSNVLGRTVRAVRSLVRIILTRRSSRTTRIYRLTTAKLWISQGADSRLYQ